MRTQKGMWMGSIVFLAGSAGMTPLYADGGSHKAGKSAHFNIQEVQRIIEEVNQRDLTLADAISKGQSECDGMAIAARGRLVEPREYARMLKMGNESLDTAGDTVVFEVTCAPRNPQGRVEAVAVLPATGDVLPFRGMPQAFRTVAQRERNIYDDFDSVGFKEERSLNRSGRQMKKLCKASKILGAEVMNHENEELGEIEDLAIDPKTGRIRYVVLDTSGRIDSGDNHFAIDLKALSPGGAGTLILPVPAEEFTYARGFDENDWPLSPDSRLTRLAMKNEEAGFFDHSMRMDHDALTSLAPAKARRVAKGLIENNFTLIDAVKYVEGKHDCHAVAACAKQDTQGRSDYGEDNLFVEVACHSHDQPSRLQLVCVSPRTGNIIRTREVALTDAFGTR